MKAGDYVYLKSGTYIAGGSLYRAKIEACTATSRISNQETITEFDNNAVVNVFPNPTKELVTITSVNSIIKSIMVTSIEGKTFYTNHDINSNEYQLNASNYQNGIYILTVETTDAKIVIQKLIKN